MDGKSVYYNRLANIGILRIGDLIYEDNKLLTNHLRELNISPLIRFLIFTESKIVCNTLIHYKLSVFYRINAYNQDQFQTKFKK